MRVLWKITVIAYCLVVVVAGAVWAQEDTVVAAIRNFSAFDKVNTTRLAAGEILSHRDDLMDFANGISVQTCFVVEASPEKTVEMIQTWDPTPHAAMKVNAFQVLHKPCVAEDFRGLRLDPKQRPMRWLIEKTAATTAERSELFLSRREAAELVATVRGRYDAEAVAAGWTKLLLARATAFQRSGLTNQPSYETSKEIVLPMVQLRLLLGEQIAVAREFAPVLRDAGLQHTGTATTTTAAKTVHYWSLFEADHRTTICLGAVYHHPVGDHHQLLDEQYYVNSNYHVSGTFYEVWPWHIGDKAASLVWREDLIAAPVLSYTKGTERLAYGVLMLQEIKQEIHFFQQDSKGK